MSTVLEVSKGYEPDGRIFEPPQVSRDNEKPRYLGCLFSMIDADTARSRPWTLAGGIEVSNPCLRFVKNFLRKGRITPLLKDTHNYLPYDLVKKTVDGDPLNSGYFPQPIPQGYVPPNLPPANGQFQPGFGNVAVGGPSPFGNLVGKLALPGEQVNAILIGSENMAQNNVPRGIVEHRSLLGQDYRPQQIGEFYVDPDIWQIQKTIFPTYPVLPVLLSDLAQIVEEAKVHTMLREIVDDFDLSLNQFRDYAEATIQKVHNEMKESATRSGYVFRYTAMDVVLLEQLGMQRQDREIRAAAGGSNQRLEGMFEQWLAISLEEKQANLERMKRAGEVNETTMMAAPPEYDGYPGQSGYSGFSGEVAVSPTEDMVVTNAASEGQEQMAEAMGDTPKAYVCGGCQKSFDTDQGLRLHQRKWCEVKKAE